MIQRAGWFRLDAFSEGYLVYRSSIAEAQEASQEISAVTEMKAFLVCTHPVAVSRMLPTADSSARDPLLCDGGGAKTKSCSYKEPRNQR